MEADTQQYNDNVFINCPYDEAYKLIFEALVFAVYALGFRPRAAKEVDNAGDLRMDRITKIIGECRYGVHDICRTELNDAGLPRFNMPLELGVFWGVRRFGDATQRKKQILILDIEQFRYQQFISDLAGCDIHAHGGIPSHAIRELRNWLRTASRRKLPSANRVIEMHEEFRIDLIAMAEADGFDYHDIPYADFNYYATGWLAST